MAENNVKALVEKGGSLIRFGSVWSYPGAPMDASGMPLEYVSDADVQAALASGEIVAATQDATGRPFSIRAAAEGQAVLTTAQAGSAEAGTELPVNSRPSMDAGMKPISAADAERLAITSMQQVGKPVAAAPVAASEGAETGRVDGGGAARRDPATVNEPVGTRRGR